ncbi:hypothetical protein [Bradyrhizobium sp. AUGA SZCCT0160]|uniref:hypothetical protein n=1 Tax=Bradyrhizobium sp. AUGA SZCCT0160 TaxID=2807662 RepID=UPI001BA645E1|nr:hypothetical protein [Bradyrhizobium sp. AUGA SZCCT0160]MBR1187349.1 hypothetical protein [Bradyrhizobium sp. AUGA SZCCT0160]
MRGGAAQQDRVAIGLGLCDEASADRTSRADLVLYDNGGLERLLQMVSEQSAGDIDDSASRIRDNQFDDAVGVGLAVGRCYANEERANGYQRLTHEQHYFSSSNRSEALRLSGAERDSGDVVGVRSPLVH